MRRAVLLDDTAGHQIRLIFNSHWIAVTCTCIQRAKGAALEMRTRWDAPEAIAVYERHHHGPAREGIPLP